MSSKPIDRRGVEPSPRQMYSLPEFGATFLIGRTKAYELANAGVIKTIRIGRRRLVPAAELERFAAELLATAS